jgi:V-type H+-transporting ATPase subunit d
MFYLKEMQMAKSSFTRQFNYGIVYAWVKLREQVSPKPKFCRGLLEADSNILVGNPKHHMDR